MNTANMLKLLTVTMITAIVSCNLSEKDDGFRQEEQEVPPFSGTIFLDPDIITEYDPTTFQDLTDEGTGERVMYDRRVNDWITNTAFLFNASYDDGFIIEVQVNPEFGSVELARNEAEKYAEVIGRLPAVLRKDVETVWIHKGTNPFGGGNRNLLIHVGQADEYINDGILEETFIHEASHTSLDADHAASTGWKLAQSADGNFISTYARDNPTREDIAESYLVFFAVKYRPDRISASLKTKIENTIQNRIKYFEDQKFNVYPVN